MRLNVENSSRQITDNNQVTIKTPIFKLKHKQPDENQNQEDNSNIFFKSIESLQESEELMQRKLVSINDVI